MKALPLLDVFEDVQVRLRNTYDSSKTPELGDELPLPDRMATVDLGALEDRLSESIEEQKANDPKELKKRIAELEKQLKAEPSVRPVVDVEARVDKAVSTAVRPLKKHIGNLEGRMGEAAGYLEGVIEDLKKARDALHLDGEAMTLQEGFHVPAKPKAPREKTPPARRKSTKPTTDLKGRQEDILRSLAGLASLGVKEVNRTRLAQRVGLSSSSGGYAGYLSDLKRRGYIDYPVDGLVSITDSGLDLVEAPPRPKTTEEIREMWREKLNSTQWAIIEILIDSHPNKISREALAERVGLSPTSGGYAGYLSELNSFGLISYPAAGHVRVSDELV